jgi:SAM-dependent methyltransferase
VTIVDATLCPHCAAPLDTRPPTITCLSCREEYPRLGAIPVLLPQPRAWLKRWALELALLERDSEAQLATLEATLDAPDLLPATEARCRAMIQAARAQAAELKAMLLPLLASAPLDGEVAPHTLTSPLLRIHYLFRDWGWDEGTSAENARALAAVAEAAAGIPLGRTLVLGAGAARLAYDLHRLGASETAVLDVDPVLFTFAHAVIHGETVRLTEPSAPVFEGAAVSRTWHLRAPHGPLDDFHFFLADGLAPPFADATFDTVVTPWFIDNVPPDFRDLLGTLARVLRPGGRWLNHGPLIYPPEMPPPRRFSREEILELAARAGFRVGASTTASVPHLVSPLNGRGRTEWTLTFAAVKEEPPASEVPPSWLLLPHLPVPTFPGQSLFWHENPLLQAVVAAVDGRRSITEIARRLAPEVQAMGLDARDLKEAVRQCLAAVHPALRLR